ncbi:MAG: hypothetical protein JWM25_1882 [Thermoleophilia bacterium]|nr:hypothetical protein [Thermoleophilia bacterium]MCZ4497297.1 hypothetical protein [Thermoleophilia bacterium]
MTGDSTGSAASDSTAPDRTSEALVQLVALREAGILGDADYASAVARALAPRPEPEAAAPLDAASTQAHVAAATEAGIIIGDGFAAVVEHPLPAESPSPLVLPTTPPTSARATGSLIRDMSWRTRIIVLAIVAVAAVLMLSALAPRQLTPEQYQAAVRDAMDEHRGAVKSGGMSGVVGLVLPGGTRRDELTAAAERYATTWKELGAELDQLQPPTELADSHAELVLAADSYAHDWSAVVDAVNEGSTTATLGAALALARTTGELETAVHEVEDDLSASDGTLFDSLDPVTTTIAKLPG